MNESTPASTVPPREPLGLRLLHKLANVVLALGSIIITGLALIGYVPTAFAALEQSFSLNSDTAKLALLLVLLTAFLVPLIVLVIAARRRWLTWPVLAPASLTVLAVLVWLTWDEPAIRQPLPITEFSPAFPGAEQSYTLLMRYSRQTTDAEARAFNNAALLASLAWGSGTTRDPVKWIALVTQHRTAIAANWAKLEPQRRWFAELNAFDRLGDLTPARLDANLPSFQVWRALSQHACAIATLQALDGHGDDAVATVLPVIELGRKLQPSARTLVRSMVGVVIERMGLETAGIVLDHASVSPASRAALAAVLANDNAPALARRLLLIEYAQFAPVFATMRLGSLAIHDDSHVVFLRGPLDLVSGLFFNPNTTTNLYGQHVFELASLAEKRELGEFAVRSKGFERAVWHHAGMKNVGGRLVLQMAMPSYEKVVDSYWQTADLRAALRKRLAAPAA